MLTTWSYSRYSTYKQCPRKAKYLYIDKFKEPQSEALEKGTIVHNKMEEYLTIDDLPIPVEAKSFGEMLAQLKLHNAVAECMWGFNKDFEQCDPWGEEVWLRGKIDAFYLFEGTEGPACKIVDFKTGKVRPKNMEQLELYALMAFKVFPMVHEVQTELWYFDDDVQQSESFFESDIPRLQATWNARIGNYFKDTRFEPAPSRLCGWCAFSKGKGGPCAF